MRHKVKWLVFWVSMVLWFGNIWGCTAPGEEQNYKSTAPERPNRFERYDSQRTAPAEGQPAGTVYVAEEVQPAAPPDTKPADVKAADPVPTNAAPAGTKTADAADSSETEPSLRGLDRSHWPKLKPRAEVGATYHGPVYYKDYPADRQEPKVNFSDPLEAQLQAALSGTRDHGLIDGHHALQLLSQPVKFGLDTILLPYRMVVTPPWKLVTTPE
jgi:hypothetical protein